MTTNRLLPLVAALVLALSACSPAPETPATGAADDAADATTDVEFAPPPSPSEPASPTAPEPPASTGPVYDATKINFGGYGTALFNSDEAAVRAAYDGTLHALPPPETPEACYYLLPGEMGGSGYARAFMFEGGKFVRVDVDTDDLVAPGGLVTGMTTADVLAAFPDAEQQPHKYTDGKYLIVKPTDGGESRLLFEVDGEGRITEWRIGLEPQVQYVEGCS